MPHPREKTEDVDEIDLDLSLTAGPEAAHSELWPDFESALDDEEPQPEYGDFLEPEPPDDAEE